MDDSIFEKFGYIDLPFPRATLYSLYAPSKFRPLSCFSIVSVYSQPKEDDAMVSVSDRTHHFNLTAHFPLRRCLMVGMFAAAL